MVRLLTWLGQRTAGYRCVVLYIGTVFISLGVSALLCFSRPACVDSGFWLSATRQYASAAQVDRLANLILSSPPNPSPSQGGLTFASVTHLLLHSASFFEHSRIRAAISSNLTSSLESKESQLNIRALSLFPKKYLDRNLRRNLVSWVSQTKPRDPEAVNLLLHYTRDDTGTPLVSRFSKLQSVC